MKNHKFLSIAKNKKVISASLKIIIPLYTIYALFMFSIFMVFIPKLKMNMLTQKKTMIRELTESAISLLSEYDHRIKKGEIGQEEAQNNAKEQIRMLRYGAEGKDYFPISKKSSKETEIQAEEPIRKDTEQILLMDDEEVLITMKKEMLERLGYQVITHINSVEALETFRSTPNRFDLVITDMAMPNLPGDRFASELSKINPDVPVLLCTGFSEIMSEEKSHSMGINGFLMKPVVMSDLSKKIRDVLDTAKGNS